MSLCIDDRPAVTQAVAYEENGGKLNFKEQ